MIKLIEGVCAIIIGISIEFYAIGKLHKSVLVFFLALFGCAIWMFGAMYLAHLYLH